MNLDWIKELIDNFPKSPKIRKNYLEIAGFPHWETVISNLLAFYFDASETEHGFKRLFVESLLDIIENKLDDEFNRSLFDTDFEVHREKVTDKGKRIDILLEEKFTKSNDNDVSNWAIIIENKVNATLYNDLKDYVNSVNAKNKICVVLSIEQVAIKNSPVKFVNILHKELVEKIKFNISDFYLDADDRHLLFLKEYFLNINTYYRYKMINENDKILKIFHDKSSEINELKEMDMELLRYVSNAVFKVMSKNHFPPYSSKNSSEGKHFHVDNEDNSLKNFDILEKFRFFVNLSSLRYSNVFEAYFELWKNENTKYGDKLKEKIIDKVKFNDFVSLGTGGKSGAGYQHIFCLSIPIESIETNGFEKQLEKTLFDHFFSRQFIEIAANELKNIINSDKK